MHGRIKCLADLFPKGNLLLDIGSDHGYLGIELLRSEKATEVWNVDLSKESLETSQRIYEKEGLESRAKFICGDGFQKVKDLPSNAIVVIAGLGSLQILKILSGMPENVGSLILMSHTDYYPIRKWARENGWSIRSEVYAEERGFYYLAMRLLKESRRREEYSEEDHIFGKRTFRKEAGELFSKYWEEKSRRVLRIPKSYRNNMEKKIIRFLAEERIIDDNENEDS